ncbi:hypothetical protein D3C71_1741900 [compost metagenome]
MRPGPVTQQAVIALAVDQVNVDRPVICQHRRQSSITLTAVLRFHEQRQSPAGVMRDTRSVPHVDRQHTEALPGRIHLTLELEFFLSADKLLLHPLLGVLFTFGVALSFNAKGG